MIDNAIEELNNRSFLGLISRLRKNDSRLLQTLGRYHSRLLAKAFAGCDYKRLLANARPDWDLRYFSKLAAFWEQLMRQTTTRPLK